MKTTLKICFFLLNYRKDTHRHYFHIYEFIEALGQKVDLMVLVMDARDTPAFSSPKEVIDLTGKGFKALLGRYRALLRARLRGYKIFYHHYTAAPARFSALLNRLTGGKTFFWHCIVMESLDRTVRAAPYHKWLLQLTFRLIHHLVTGSDFMADYYASHYGISRKKIRVIPNYINLQRFQSNNAHPEELRRMLGIPPDRKVILYLHEIEEGRAAGLPDIIKGVLQRRSDVVFVIAGDGRYRKTLEQRLAARVEEGIVHFTGRVPNTETPRYYAGADVYIMTSEFEAFSRVLLESMAMGTPYVATDGGGGIRAYTPPEHQPFILNAQNINRFPECIDRLLRDTATRDRFIKAGLEHVKAFDMECVLKRFIEMLTV